VLIFVLDLSANPEDDFAIVRREVVAFDEEMLARPALIALNKLDLVTPDEAEAIAHSMRERTGLATFAISAQDGVGLEPLVTEIARQLKLSEEPRAECRS
jgi:GTP-binding protein